MINKTLSCDSKTKLTTYGKPLKEMIGDVLDATSKIREQSKQEAIIDTSNSVVIFMKKLLECEYVYVYMWEIQK